jgi:hypothetical protein
MRQVGPQFGAFAFGPSVLTSKYSEEVGGFEVEIAFTAYSSIILLGGYEGDPTFTPSLNGRRLGFPYTDGQGSVVNIAQDWSLERATYSASVGSESSIKAGPETVKVESGIPMPPTSGLGFGFEFVGSAEADVPLGQANVLLENSLILEATFRIPSADVEQARRLQEPTVEIDTQLILYGGQWNITYVYNVPGLAVTY